MACVFGMRGFIFIPKTKARNKQFLGDMKSRRSDSDTESLSESLSLGRLGKKKSSDEKEKKRLHHHQHRHHSRTRSMPTCPMVVQSDDRDEAENERQNRIWTGRAYERMNSEKDTSSSVRYRTEIPKLMRPTSLLFEREQSKMEKIDDELEAWNSKNRVEKEKDFYDILAEKYGITKVRRYDLPREKRDGKGYQDITSRIGCVESRETREKSDEKEKDGQKKSEKAESSELYVAPSERLATVLNQLESRGERGSNLATAADNKTKMDKGENEKVRSPKKVMRHFSDLTLKEYNGVKEKEKKWHQDEFVLNKYPKYHTLDKNKKTWKKEEDEEKPTKKYVDTAIRSLRENLMGLEDVSSENVLIKRAVSMSDCVKCDSYPGSKANRSTVNSVVGMFNQMENTADLKKKEADWEKQQDGGSEKSKIPLFRRKSNVASRNIDLPVAGKVGPTAMNYHSSQERRLSNDYLTSKDSNFEDPNNFLSADSESFDSWSFCSDLGNADDIILKNYPNRQGNVDDLLKESVSDRIRRKSFYTRFNDWKKPRRSLLLSRSYEPENDTDSGCFKPMYYRSVSTGDDPRPRPFYKSQTSECQPSQKKDSNDWSRTRALSPSYLRSGSHSPSSYSTLNFPRNASNFEGGRNYRSMSVYSQRPFSLLRPRSPSLRVESPTDYLE